MHFAWGLGNTLGPLVASPFLRKDQGSQIDKDHFGITVLYPIVGSIASVCGLSFLVKEVYNKITKRKTSHFVEPEEVRLHSSIYMPLVTYNSKRILFIRRVYP